VHDGFELATNNWEKVKESTGNLEMDINLIRVKKMMENNKQNIELMHLCAFSVKYVGFKSDETN